MKTLLISIFALTFALTFTIAASAQSFLSPGDLAIICVNSDGAKSFEVLFFCEVEAGTVIHFTDNAWMDEEQEFRDTEGVLTFTAAETISAGAVVACPSKDGGNGFVESGSFNPAGSGDNIIVYQGASDDPFFIYGIGWARGASVWEYSTVSASYRSDVPMGLSFEDGTVVGLGTSDDYRYVGMSGFGISGSREELFAVLSDASNFESSNSSEFLWIEGDFSVSSALTSSSEWVNSPTNWSNIAWTNDAPTRFSEVEINGHFQISHSVTTHSVTIQAGAQLEILPGGALTVIGELINLADANALVIRADEGGSGALYSSSEDVKGSVELYVSPDQWHFVSSPVTGSQTLSEVFGTVGDHLYGVYTFDESTAQWISADPSEGVSELPGTGFNAYYQDDAKTLTFVGTLNNFRNRRFVTVSRGAGGGWNLIGNPFPAPMCWSQYMIQENLEHETIYITTGGSGDNSQWDTFNGISGIGVPANNVGNVAIGQAFWMRSGDGGGRVGVGCYAKTHGESRFKSPLTIQRSKLYADPELSSDDNYFSRHWGSGVVRLQLLDVDGGVDQVAVCFDRNTDLGFDEMDSEKMGWEDGQSSSKEKPASDLIRGRMTKKGGRKTNNEGRMAVPIEGKACVIASYPFPASPELTRIIPLTIYSDTNSLFSLQLVGSKNDFTSIILEDRLLGIMHNFSNQPVYEFHAGDGFLFNRFFLRVSFGSGHGIDDLLGEEELTIEAQISKVEFYSIDGRQIEDIDRYRGVFIKRYFVNGALRAELLYR